MVRYVEILTVDIYVKVFTVLCHELFSNPRFLCLINCVGSRRIVMINDRWMDLNKFNYRLIILEIKKARNCMNFSWILDNKIRNIIIRIYMLLNAILSSLLPFQLHIYVINCT